MDLFERKLASPSNPVYAVVRHDNIHRQSVKPRRQRAFPFKKVQLPPGPNERLLGEFFGEVRIASEPPAQCVDPPDLLSVDLLESLLISILSALHERFRPFLR